MKFKIDKKKEFMHCYLFAIFELVAKLCVCKLDQINITMCLINV